MKYILHYTLLILITAFAVISSCGNNHNNNQPTESMKDSSIATKASYDLEKVERCEMKKKLKEISGLHYVNDDLFVAIQDESGIIFTVRYSNCDITDEFRFAGKGDYEDIALDNDFYYVLESTGKIFKVPRKGDTSGTKTYEIPFKKRMEFESIYLDPSGENLVMVCKNCHGKKNNLMKYAYAFNIKKEAFADEPIFSLDLGDKDLKPSATAINPVEKKLYVLCSVGKSLVVCDLNGKREQVMPLNPMIYKQPEGIAFTPNGDMYISNEATDDKGNILKIAYK
ncbi:MAG: SdiA-regulated domain-containing protein [Chitinophagaceae bacterium]